MAYDWNLAIYCRNERQGVVRSIRSVLAGIGTHRAALCIIVNGSTDGSAEAAAATIAESSVPATVHTIAHADKSNAINQFLYNLRQPAGLYFGIDAHTTIEPAALAALADALAANPTAHASTGVAANGRTMRAATAAGIAQGGRLNGPLYALRASFVERMTSAGIRLPVDHYRGDGLLGSLLAHDLDALGTPWDNARTLSVPAAPFHLTVLSPWRPADILRQLHRTIRQMRGRIENEVVKEVIYTRGFQHLPADMNPAIADRVARHGIPPTAWHERPFMALALRANARAMASPAADLAPRLFFANAAAQAEHHGAMARA